MQPTPQPFVAPAVPHEMPARTLGRLLALDHDAVASYRAAMARVDRSEVRSQLSDFVADHERHIAELAPHVSQPVRLQAEGPSDGQLLLAGKMMVAQVMGDKAVLGALRDVAERCNLAYEQALQNDALAPQALAVVQRNFADERRHRHWFTQALGGHPHAAADTDAFDEMAALLLPAQDGETYGEFRAPPY